MEDNILSIAVILIILSVNVFFVIAEVAFLTASKSKLHQMGAKKAYDIIQQPEVFLSTVQVGITLMGLMMGLIGGGSLGAYISDYLITLIPDAKYAYAIGYILAFCIVTYFTVLLEVFPKRVAMLYPERIASLCSYGMYIFIKIMYPFVKLLTFSSKICMKLFMIKEKDSKVSVDEIKFLVNQAFSAGVLDDTEKNMIKRIINVGDMQVGAIMTPRNKIIALDLNDNVENNIQKIKESNLNYFPVIDGSLNKLIGIVSVKGLFGALSNLSNGTIKKIASEFTITYIPEMSHVTHLIDLLKTKQTKIAIVIDEYGDIGGLVTFSDIIRAFVGDVGVILKGEKRYFATKKDGSYEVDGNIPIEEVMEKLHLTSMPNDDTEDYRTLASFILKQMEYIPKEGESLIASGWKFTILKMERFRIAKVKISKVN